MSKAAGALGVGGVGPGGVVAAGSVSASDFIAGDCAVTLVDTPAYSTACPVDSGDREGTIDAGVEGGVWDTCTDADGETWVKFNPESGGLFFVWVHTDCIGHC